MCSWENQLSFLVCDGQKPSQRSSLRLYYSWAFVSPGSQYQWAITSKFSGLSSLPPSAGEIALASQIYSVGSSGWSGGGGVGGGSSFVYCFLPQVIYTISSYSVLFLPSPFQLYLITCMHFPSYPPAHYFPKTRASPSKCNKTLQKKGGIVVWTGWLQDAGLKRLHIIFNCFALHLTVSGKYGCLRNMRILWLFSKNSPIHLQTLMTWPSRCLSESI